jgi:hypothetical protein
MTKYRGVEVQLHTFLTSALDIDKWSASRPGCCTPEKIACIHWIGTWMGTTASLDLVAKCRIWHLLGIKLPVIQPIVGHYTD